MRGAPLLSAPLFTFDDGPSEFTAPILALLAEYEQSAVFFIVGQTAAARPDLLAELATSGQTIGVHGWSHKRLAAMPAREAEAELRRTRDLIAAAQGSSPGWWRAPFFDTTAALNQAAQGLGLANMGANVIPDDWKSDDAELIAAKVLGAAWPQAVICLHDGVPPGGGSETCTQSRQPTVDALRIILEALA